MIETEEQRRWWFATHPEYSSNRKGVRSHTHENKGDESSKPSPEAVDAYVDKMLGHADGSVADLLRSIKRNFGTEGNSQNAEQRLAESAEGRKAGDGVPAEKRNTADGSDDYGWHNLTESYGYGGFVFPRLPTTAELSRWPKEMVRRFFRWIDSILQNNPLLIDPDALERHHGLSKEFIKYFLDSGLEIEQFIIILREPTIDSNRMVCTREREEEETGTRNGESS